MSSAGENTTQQDGRVDRRDFGIPNSLAGVDVSEVVEKSPMGRHLFPEEAQSRQNPIPRIGRCNEFPLFPDTKSGQPKSCCRNTATIELSSFATLHRSLINPVCGLACSRSIESFAFPSPAENHRPRARGRPQPAKAGKPALPAFRRSTASYPGRYRESQQTKATDLKKEFPSRKAFLRKFIFFRAHQVRFRCIHIDLEQ